MKEIGRRLCRERIKRGYTREQLSNLADVSPQLLSDIENGDNVDFGVSVLYKLCIVLKADCNIILTGKKHISYELEGYDLEFFRSTKDGFI